MKTDRVTVEKLLNFCHVEDVDGAIKLLTQVIDNPWNYYRSRIILTRGKRRHLTIPTDEFKYLLTTVFQPVLSKVSVHKTCHAYRPKMSGWKVAKFHIKPVDGWHEDLKDFYMHVSKDLMAQELNKVVNNKQSKLYGWDCDDLLSMFVLDRGIGLPQGSPVSPALSNIVGYEMDEELYNLAIENQAGYTRWSDNLIFSSRVNRKVRENMLHRVRDIIKSYGFQINYKKYHRIGKNRRNLVLGYVVNDKINLPRERRKKIRAMVHNYTVGNSHIDTTLAMIRGHLAWLSTANPEEANKLKKKLNLSILSCQTNILDQVVFNTPICENTDDEFAHLCG